MRIFNRIKLPLIVAVFAFFTHGALLAQFASAPNVDKITFRLEGPQDIARDAVMAHMKLRSGMPFDQHALDVSIKSLYETGLYETIEAKRTLTPAGKMNIEILIRPKYRISQIVFRGNSEYRTSRIQDQVASRAGGVLDERAIKRDADKIEEFYRKKGYALARVKFNIERDSESGRGVVIFDINEGQDIKIKNIRFVGNDNIESGRLLDQMKTGTWMWLISYLLEVGRFKDDEFQADIASLKQYYRNHGYLDVQIDESKIRMDFPDPDNLGYMDIVIEIVEGRQYRTGKVEFKIDGTKLEEELRVLTDSSGVGRDLHTELPLGMDIWTGDIFSPARLDSSLAWIKDFYGYFGYLDADAYAVRKANLETAEIDLVINITEREKYFLESINIQGNTKTRSEVIIRELALQPGDVFHRDKMKNSEMALRNTRFFDEVALDDERTNIPGRRDLRIIVKEGRTGNMTFGAGFSTVESFVVTAEVSQSNFDFLNWRNMFTGGGQKFRIRGSLGLESNQIMISFANPWIFNRRLEYGFDLYRTDTGYYSDYYSELRLGMMHYLRKYLFEKVEGRLGYTLEDVNLYDMGSDTPPMIRDEEGHRSVSKVSLSFLRDNRDSTMMPTDGTRLEFLQQVAGGPLLGETNIYKVEARAGWWFPVSRHFGQDVGMLRYGDQVFSIVGRVGSITGYGGKDVPYFEKYFLGGAYNLRGYKFRKAGRTEAISGEPYGGNTMGYISMEYSWRIIEQFRIAVFYDIGFLNDNSWDFDPSKYSDDFGIGFRIMLMGAPMRIDIGVPLTTGNAVDDGVQFNFSFGAVF